MDKAVSRQWSAAPGTTITNDRHRSGPSKAIVSTGTECAWLLYEIKGTTTKHQQINHNEGKNIKKDFEVFNFYRDSYKFQRVSDDRYNEVRNVKQPK